MRHSRKDHRFLFVCGGLGLALLLSIFGPIGCNTGRVPVEVRPGEEETTKPKDAGYSANKFSSDAPRSKDSVKDTAKDTVKDTAKDVVKDTVRDFAKDAKDVPFR